MTKPLFSVIIVSWNVAASLKHCLDSVLATRYPHLEIIVIDNFSSDTSVAIAGSYPSVKLIKNSANLGFPKSVNQGLRLAAGEYLVILNPDTRIPPDFFTRSLEFYDHFSAAGVMGPKLVDPDGTPQGSVFPEPSIVNEFREFWLGHPGLTSKYIPPGSTPVEVNALSGACLVFPRSTLTKIGLLTEKVFMYYEDLDYCRRLRRSGLKVYFNPQITVIHEHGQSSKQSARALTYLNNSSRWYNGWLKYTLMFLISWTGQKFGPKSL